MNTVIEALHEATDIYQGSMRFPLEAREICTFWPSRWATCWSLIATRRWSLRLPVQWCPHRHLGPACTCLLKPSQGILQDSGDFAGRVTSEEQCERLPDSATAQRSLAQDCTQALLHCSNVGWTAMTSYGFMHQRRALWTCRLYPYQTTLAQMAY